ncbi:MAG TPA: TonB-dependent receptor [Bacteroidales bacterium]|nr:TonB-dependent receptor [Bacteroidales bacterium]
MQKALLTLLLAITTVFANNIQSQQPPTQIVKFTGVVTDSISGETVPYATVSAINIISPTPLKRIAADDKGKFEITIGEAENQFLLIDAVGMKTKFIPLTDYSKSIIDLGNISIIADTEMLSEVTVIATKPLVKVELDKIVYDTSADPESKSNNVLEMMRKVPLLTVDAEDNIKLKGKSNFKIYMNGKPTNIFANNPSQVLKTMPANTVKNIEIITEPGAKYESEGVDGIINIVMEKTVAGYNGSVNAGIDMYGALNGGLYFSTKIGKWGITSNFNGGQFINPGVELDYNLFNKMNKSKLSQHTELIDKGLYGNGNLNINYEIDTLNLLSISGSGWMGNNRNSGDIKSKMHDAYGNLMQSYIQARNSKFTWNGFEANVDYQRSFSKKDKLFTLSYKLSSSPGSSDRTTDITEAIYYPINKQHIWNNSTSDEHTFQIDYIEPFNKKHIVEVGAKYILRNNISNNHYEQFASDSTTPEPIPGMIDDRFIHHQDVLGIYAAYTFRQMKYSFKVGGRFENTGSKVSYENQPELNFKPEPFNNLVPSFNFNYKLTNFSNIQLSYTQRLRRPSIHHLNPFKNYSSPTNVQIGNPGLNTEVNNSFSLNYGLFSQKFNFSTSAFHSFTNNSIEQFVYLKNDTTVTTYNNIGKNRNTGVSTYFRWQITPAINTYFNGSTSYSFLSDGNNENKGFNYGGSLGSGITLPKDFRVNLFTGLFKMDVSLQGGGSHLFFYGLSANKSFLEKKLTVSLNASMFLQKYMQFSFYTDTETFRADTELKRLAPNLRLSVTYTFGEMKEQIKRAKRTIKNDDLKSSGDNTGTMMGTGSGTGGMGGKP